MRALQHRNAYVLLIPLQRHSPQELGERMSKFRRPNEARERVSP